MIPYKLLERCRSLLDTDTDTVTANIFRLDIHCYGVLHDMRFEEYGL